MIMYCKTINTVLIVLSCGLFLHEKSVAQFGIDWTGLATQAIDETSRSEVQKIFSSLTTIQFSEAKIQTYRKSASSIGLHNPTTVDALMNLEYGIKPLVVSSLPIIENQELVTLGNGRFRNITASLIDNKEKSLQKIDLSDYLNAETMDIVRQLDIDGTFSSLLKQSMNLQLALMFNNRPQFLNVVKDNPILLQSGLMRLIPYWGLYATPHKNNFKLSAIPDVTKWDLTLLNDSSVLISSQSGEIARIHFDDNSTSDQLAIAISEIPILLNCELPPSASINFGTTAYVTDCLGRIAEVRFIPFKTKFKDSKKVQLKNKDIVIAKAEANSKPLMLVPQKYGGTETWCNVIPYVETKENKAALKILDKRLSELAKTGSAEVRIRILYDSTSSHLSGLQYFSGNSLICTLKGNTNKL